MHTFSLNFFFEISFCVLFFGQMVHIGTKIHKVGCSIFVEVTKSVKVFKNINFLKNGSYFKKR